MAFGDWTQYVNQGWVFAINVTTPLVGIGSGRFTPAPFGAGTDMSNIVVTNLSGRTKGVTQGKIRSLFRYTNPPTAGTLNGFGFTFMMSAENVSTSTGNFYGAGYDFNTGRLHIRKATLSSLSSIGSGTGLAQSEIVTPGNGVVMSLEVEWIADTVELGGTAIFVRTGSLNDFSDLTTVISYLDTATPYTTTVAESIYIITGNGIGAAWSLDFDQTTLFIP